jgi:hypothetical protein
MSNKVDKIDVTTGEITVVGSQELEVADDRDFMVATPGESTEIYGFKIADNLTFDQRVKMIAVITEVVQGESFRMDRYINTPVIMLGVVYHNCTINVSKRSKVYHPDGSEITKNARRTVFIAHGAKGKIFPEPVKIGFVAQSVDNFLDQILLPMCGIGIWPKPIIMTFSKDPGGSNAYNIVINGVYEGNW